MLGMTKDQFLGFVRHLVTFIGGIIVAKGKLDPMAVETIGGVLVTVAGLVFSFMAPEKAAAPAAVPSDIGARLALTTAPGAIGKP